MAEAEARLAAARSSLTGLQGQHEHLLAQHEHLQGQFDQLQAVAVEVGWNYCPDKSADFQHIPRMDPLLLESEAFVGAYSVHAQLGKGRYSVVRSAFLTRERERELEPTALPGASPAASASASAASSASASGALVSQCSGLAVGSAVAIKSIDKRCVPCIADIMQVEVEVRALLLLSKRGKESCSAGAGHASQMGRANVVRIYEVLHGPRCLHVVTECVPLDLFAFMQQFRQRISSNVAAVLVKDAAAGLHYLQQHGLCHRDLTPENLLVAVGRHDLSLKICDMRLCAFVEPALLAKKGKEAELEKLKGDEEEQEEKEEQRRERESGPKHTQRAAKLVPPCPEPEQTLLSDFAGSPGFFAPEILLQRAYHGFSADVWSLGCVALELLVRPAFFSGTWLAAYQTLHTQHAPEFPRRLREASAAAIVEVQELHGGGPGPTAYPLRTPATGISSLLASLLAAAPGARPTTDVSDD